MPDLVPLPEQSESLSWPTEDWQQAELPACVNLELLTKTLDAAFAQKTTDYLGESLACVVIHKGKLVVERYGEGHTKDDTFISWSMAKSIMQALVGILVKQNKINIHAPTNIIEWQRDERKNITLDQMLRMCDGLDFNEEYVDDTVSNVIEMLFDEVCSKNVSGYAINRPLKHAPDTVWNYSSGTSNIVSKLVKDLLETEGKDYAQFMQEVLFKKIGMNSAEPKFDEAGNFIASSFVYATARDFAKFGYLYLRNGVWEGERILPEGWVDYTRTPTPQSFNQERGPYGAHFWLVEGSLGIFACQGYEGQRIMMVPKLDLIVVRLGKTPLEAIGNVDVFMKNIVDAFRPCA